ncbi:MAG: L-lysine 6-transaminase [Thermoanaerobaculaceae bacterium]|nr:L-lysine 6-transaminase [Thermoanaerobaculaceae bacterium]
MVTVRTAPRVPACAVHDTLARHILVDGFHIVPDLARSHGSWLVDERDGREYLDLFSNFASQALGWNHPALGDPEFRERLLLAALHKPANSDVYTSFYAEFVATFAQLAVPESHAGHLFFVEGGALAVENALKAAFDWKVRRNRAQGQNPALGTKVLHFRQAFHGRSGYTLSLTNTFDPRKTELFPTFDWPRISNPKIVFPLAEHLSEVEAAEGQALAEIAQAVERHGDDIACLIVEPIQAEGGDNHFRPEFLAALRRVADEHDFLLIFDEVQTGLGLTGSMWAWQGLGVEPDLFCFGKKVQTCGFAANRRIDQVPDNVFVVPSRINSTWGGNLTDMVRATRVLEVIAAENLVANARSQGAYLLGGLEELARQFPSTISQVRGRGLMLAFDCPNHEARHTLLVALRERGLLVLPCGPRGIRLRPFLDLTRADADEALRRLAETLHHLT